MRRQYEEVTEEYATYRRVNEKMQAMFIAEVRLNSLAQFAEDDVLNLL